MVSQSDYNKVKKKSPADWKKTMDEFEKAKKTVEIKDEGKTVTITPSSDEMMKAFKKSKNRQDIKIDERGKLLLPVSFIINKTVEVAKKITSHIEKEILSEIDDENLDAVLLVGGFANSPIVSDEIRRLFRNQILLIVPENSELCVVKGAVLFGWKRDIIRSRKSRYTYGFCVNEEIDDAPVDEFKNHAFFLDNTGRRMCNYVFDKLVAKNQDISNGQVIEYSGQHAHKDARFTSIALYRSLSPDPKYCNVNGVDKVGEVKIAKHSDGTCVNMRIYFGDTEISMEVVDEATAEIYRETFNFLIDRTMKFGN